MNSTIRALKLRKVELLERSEIMTEKSEVLKSHVIQGRRVFITTDHICRCALYANTDRLGPRSRSPDAVIERSYAYGHTEPRLHQP